MSAFEARVIVKLVGISWPTLATLKSSLVFWLGLYHVVHPTLLLRVI